MNGLRVTIVLALLSAGAAVATVSLSHHGNTDTTTVKHVLINEGICTAGGGCEVVVATPSPVFKQWCRPEKTTEPTQIYPCTHQVTLALDGQTYPGIMQNVVDLGESHVGVIKLSKKPADEHSLLGLYHHPAIVKG